MIQKDENTETVFVREVSAQYHGRKQPLVHIGQPADAAAFIRSVLPDNSREHFVTLHLDGAHQVIAYSITGTGGANFCHVHPREVFQTAFLVGAVALVVGHNHPSNSITPSVEDRKITERLKEAGDLLGIKVLDHVLVCEELFYSIETDDAGELSGLDCAVNI
jgi:DNA repair protein RadC